MPSTNSNELNVSVFSIAALSGAIVVSDKIPNAIWGRSFGQTTVPSLIRGGALGPRPWLAKRVSKPLRWTDYAERMRLREDGQWIVSKNLRKWCVLVVIKAMNCHCLINWSACLFIVVSSTKWCQVKSDNDEIDNIYVVPWVPSWPLAL